MARTRQDFFNDFDELMNLNDIINSVLPPTHRTAGLKTLDIYNYEQTDTEEVGPEDIVRIVDGIREGDREQMNRWRVLSVYLIQTLDKIEDNQESRPNYDWIYGYDRNLDVDVKEIEKKMEIIIRRLLNDLSDDPNEFARFFELMKPSEQMALASLERQGTRTAVATTTTPERRKRLLPELFREEIAPFVGKQLKGGKTKGKRKMRMRKHKTIRRKARKTKKNKRKFGRKQTRQRAGGFTITEETSPESYDDDYENNLANMEALST